MRYTDSDLLADAATASASGKFFQYPQSVIAKVRGNIGMRRNHGRQLRHLTIVDSAYAQQCRRQGEAVRHQQARQPLSTEDPDPWSTHCRISSQARASTDGRMDDRARSKSATQRADRPDEILFAYSSCFANNGQSFAGLSANSVFYNLTTALAMMAGRFGLAIPALAQVCSQGREIHHPL